MQVEGGERAVSESGEAQCPAWLHSDKPPPPPPILAKSSLASTCWTSTFNTPHTPLWRSWGEPSLPVNFSHSHAPLVGRAPACLSPHSQQVKLLQIVQTEMQSSSPQSLTLCDIQLRF